MRHESWSRASVVSRIALPLALVAFLPSAVGLYVVSRHNDRLHRQQVALAGSLAGVEAVRLLACERQNEGRATVRVLAEIVAGLVSDVSRSATTRNPARDAAFARTLDRLAAQRAALAPVDCAALPRGSALP